MPPDPLLTAIATYAKHYVVRKHLETARCCFMEALARGLTALRSPAITRLARPLFPGAVMPGGARVPGTSFELDPVQAAFGIGALVGQGSGAHPSHPMGAILAVADYLARKAIMEGKPPPTVREVLAALVKAHEVQVLLARENGLSSEPHQICLTRVAATAVVTALLGGTLEQITNAISSAWLDGVAVCPPGEARTRWAIADAASQAVRHALLALRGEMGYPSALTAEKWGFCCVLLGGQPLCIPSFATRALDEITPDLAVARAQLEAAVDEGFLPRRAERIKALFALPHRVLDALPVNELMAELVSTAPGPQDPQGRLALALPEALQPARQRLRTS